MKTNQDGMESKMDDGQEEMKAHAAGSLTSKIDIIQEKMNAKMNIQLEKMEEMRA
jgi:hypothetical protein